VTVGGARISSGDLLVMDEDGVAVIEPARVEEVLHASLEREVREADKREKLRAGNLSYDLDGLRERVEGAR
jgi:4-hydroxy-4-methyl-2-oxoglutarate aldolase